MRISQAFPSKYLKASDLQEKAHLLTIAKIDIEDVGSEGSPEHKPVLYFQGAQKGIVLNRTNADTLAYLYGDETDGWAGKQIEVYPDTVHFQGKLVPCIRLRRRVEPAQQAGFGTPPATEDKQPEQDFDPLDGDRIPF